MVSYSASNFYSIFLLSQILQLSPDQIKEPPLVQKKNWLTMSNLFSLDVFTGKNSNTEDANHDNSISNSSGQYSIHSYSHLILTNTP